MAGGGTQWQPLPSPGRGEDAYGGATVESKGYWESMAESAPDYLSEGVIGKAEMEGAGGVCSLGLTGAEGAITLGHGLLVVGGAALRVRDVQKDVNDGDDGGLAWNPSGGPSSSDPSGAISGIGYDPFKRHPAGRW